MGATPRLTIDAGAVSPRRRRRRAPARGIAGPPGLPAPVRAKLEQAFAAALADPAFLRKAQRVFLPLRPLAGADHRGMAERVDGSVRALWQVRPWSS